MLKQYETIIECAEAKINDKKSQFIADIFPVHSEDEVKEKITFVKKKYKDAKHYVYAYRLSNGLERYSDDGEPSGTAGVPILDILRGKNLYDILVVVTRYFGGILLGTGGLVKAYSDATNNVLENANQVKMNLAIEYTIVVRYQDYSILQHFCSKNNFVISKSSFSDSIELNIVIPDEKEDYFTKELSELLDGKLEITNIRKGIYI